MRDPTDTHSPHWGRRPYTHPPRSDSLTRSPLTNTAVPNSASNRTSYGSPITPSDSDDEDFTAIPIPTGDDEKTSSTIQATTQKKRSKWGHKKGGSSKSGSTDTELKKDDDDKDSQDPLAHLPPHEQAILRKQLETPQVIPGIKMIYRYASRNDLIIMTISAICAIAGGAVMPLMTVVFGNLTGTFQDFLLYRTLTRDGFNDQLTKYTLYFLYLGIGEFVTIYVATAGLIYTGEHIAAKIREQYLAAILRQNIGYFDKLGAGEITTRITADTNLIQDGISEKVALTLTALATFITAFIIGFVKYWLLALILSSSIFAIVLIMGSASKSIVQWNKAALDAYALGGTVAEEVLSSIRNATAFSTQDKLAKQYDVHLQGARYWGLRHKGIMGVLLGVMFLIIYLNYALAFWMGSRFLVRGQGGVTLSDILTILLSIMIGAFSLGNVAPNAQAFTTGVAAAGKIFSTIDRVSPLDPMSKDGKKLVKVEGNVELRNVKHIYPSRPEVVVMADVSMFIPAGKTTALVGASGSGKSTIVGLVERFYDPVGGTVLFDGVDVRDLNLHFLRQQISLVSQEPTLFSTTIFGNIAHGLIGTEWEDLPYDDKMEMIVEAARMANAHEFIISLPEKYETNVGERGFLLSGGQKQRIAIARAVVSDPKVLLLDEATSALDTKSEGVVQAALDKAAAGRTTIVIAHRLSTIKDADNIIVMTEGRIVEQGTHNSLLRKQGAYFSLVEAQKIAAANKQDESDDEDDDFYDAYSRPANQRTPSISSNHSRTSFMSRLSNQFSNQRRRMSRTRSTGAPSAWPMQRMSTAQSLGRVSTKQSMGMQRMSTANSIAAQVLKDKLQAEKDGPKYSLSTLIMTVANFNRTDWKIMLSGLIASIIAGGGQPVQSVFFAKCIVALAKPPFQYDQLRHDVNYWCWMYFMLAWVLFFAYSVQGVAFAYCSEGLILRARNQAFRAMLRQDISFFDREENSAGVLTSFLSTETTHLAGLSGSTLGTIFNVVTTLVAAIALSLAIGWKLALVCISTLPILVGCGYFRFWMLARFQTRAKRAYERSASYACEATSAIRTVASLCREQDVWDHYHEQLVDQGKRSLRSVLKSSALYAASQAFMFLCIALGFWYGGQLISRFEYDLQSFFIVFSSVIFGAQSAGTIFSFAPDMGKAKHAAAELKTLSDRVPPIDSWSATGDPVTSCTGRIEFRNVHFRYPTRPEQPVLRGLDLVVEPGQYVALVGASGCGKSTTIAMLERFYDPQSGTVSLDGRDISELNLNAYRSHLALVSQEPTLYQGTIRDNVLLGADRPVDEVPDSKIEQACRDANIFNFITSLPDGFQTVVGNKGVMLSGGQKQRLAIARALLRDPKVLLLDEATSALDSESEKVVQAALDHAAKGRTTIAVAHRLSTIQRADMIYVFDSGRVVESGTHNELMNARGRYFELVNLQSLERL
ncbi:hypothetical protein FH972_023597 [Carpinus fangiana]|uniref:Uncharacterized protein n=1 Tax=Carpinus fangiana TaxID=176857 RepID=A0A5N6KW94_9ROSI|nr:hypothetical protein FH972_023597 [Carpinus fangiana]